MRLGSSPQWISMRTNCSYTICTFSSTFTTHLLPIHTEERLCSAGISSGKLNGVMTDVAP